MHCQNLVASSKVFNKVKKTEAILFSKPRGHYRPTHVCRHFISQCLRSIICMEEAKVHYSFKYY
jgi:hypothetical protein